MGIFSKMFGQEKSTAVVRVDRSKSTGKTEHRTSVIDAEFRDVTDSNPKYKPKPSKRGRRHRRARSRPVKFGHSYTSLLGPRLDEGAVPGGVISPFEVEHEVRSYATFAPRIAPPDFGWGKGRRR